MIATAVLIGIVGTLNIVCFFVGARVGQTAAKGEKIEVPSVHPIECIRRRDDEREAKRKQEQVEVIMRNIENYDGTDRGQEEVPRG